MSTRRLVPLVAIAVATGLLAACGGGPGSTEPAAAVRSDRGMIEFARCMRTHGIGMADPFHRPGHVGLSIDLPEQGPATTDAYRACQQFLEPTIELKQQAAARTITPALRLALIHYAGCMRSRSVPMLDPDATGALSLGNVPGIGNGFGRYTPQFQAADQVCRRLLPGSVHDDGTGP